MSWKVTIHPLVVKEDLKEIDPPQARKIIKAIEQRLGSRPKEYGEPLLGAFRRYWKLRVGDYRVIYEIVENKVLVLVVKIGLRRDSKVYDEFFNRLKKLS